MKFGVFNDECFPVAFYSDDINDNIPENAVFITDEQWQEFIDNQGLRQWKNGEIVTYTPPEPEPLPIKVAIGVFFNRTSESEADEIDIEMNKKSVKIRRQWQAATVLEENTDLWNSVKSVIQNLYGNAKAEELLSAS